MKLKVKHEKGYFLIGVQCSVTKNWIVTTLPLHPLVRKVVKIVKLEDGATIDMEVEGTYISDIGSET